MLGIPLFCTYIYAAYMQCKDTISAAFKNCLVDDMVFLDSGPALMQHYCSVNSPLFFKRLMAMVIVCSGW